MAEANYVAIVRDGDVGKLVDAAKTVGNDLARQLTTYQIRNVFGEVRQIEMSWPEYPEEKQGRALTEDELARRRNAEQAYRRTVLLRPKLAYQARAERGRGVLELQNVLDPCLKVIQEAGDFKTRRLYFQRFVDFFEAILAYHKAAGGN
jgi:CRISPR-associated protein Csm2